MKNLKVKKVVGLGILLIFALTALSSCNEDFEVYAYKALAAASTSYDTTMRALGDLYAKGEISKTTKDKVIMPIANKYYAAFQIASSSFESYIAGKDEETKDKLVKSLEALNMALTEFLSLAAKYIQTPVNPSAVK